MARFCSNCGSQLNEGVKFCNECGAKTEAPVQITQEQAAPLPTVQHTEAVQPPAQTLPPQAVVAAPPIMQAERPVVQTAPLPTARPISTLQYIGYIFLMGLPGVGLVLSILWSVKKGQPEKRSLARAMILFSIISIIVCVAMAIMLFIYTQVVAELHFKLFSIQLF